MLGACRLYLNGEQLDGRQPVRDSQVREGAVVALDEPLASVPESEGFFDLSIVSGPGAGIVHRVPLGEATVGTARSCTIIFEQAELPDVALKLRSSRDGVKLVPVPGVDLPARARAGRR